MNTLAPAAAGYLAEAADSGLLRELHGHPYVVGTYHDPLADEVRGLVEFCDPRLVEDASRLDDLVVRLRQDCPEAVRLLLRVPGDLRLRPPWSPQITYLRYVGGQGDHAGDHRPPDGCAVRPAAGARELALVEEWLLRAFLRGYADQGAAAGAQAARGAVRETLEVPERVSFVAVPDGRPVGHATVCPGHDTVTDRPYLDLVDILVDLDDAPARRSASAALTRAAIDHAHRLDLPLIGHVVHPDREVDPTQGERVVAALTARGWRTDHAFWRRDPAPGDREPGRTPPGAPAAQNEGE